MFLFLKACPNPVTVCHNITILNLVIKYCMFFLYCAALYKICLTKLIFKTWFHCCCCCDGPVNTIAVVFCFVFFYSVASCQFRVLEDDTKEPIITELHITSVSASCCSLFKVCDFWGLAHRLCIHVLVFLYKHILFENLSNFVVFLLPLSSVCTCRHVLSLTPFISV